MAKIGFHETDPSPMQSLRRTVLVVLAATLWPAWALAAGPTNLDARGVAIHGHDPVAYLVDARPVAGRPEHQVTVGAATYWFASEANLQAFKADPSKYEPQYGGYCAYGVAQGYKPDIDPTAFRIVDGKLYLNLSPAVQKRWVEDIPGHISRANQNWTSLRNQ
jgi:YHS domain-containing protein